MKSEKKFLRGVRSCAGSACRKEGGKRIPVFVPAILIFLLIAYAVYCAVFCRGSVMPEIPFNRMSEIPFNFLKLPASANPAASEMLPFPSVSAESAVLIEKSSGRILYEKYKDMQLPPASTTNIMTALLACEWAEDSEIAETPESETQQMLDRRMKASENAVSTEGSSIYLKEGEEVTFRDLLYGMMLRSGNDAATAISENIAGSTQEFVNMMNERAESLEMNNTSFENPTGLHAEHHFSSAYDLALLAREALNHEIFRKVASSKVWHASREGKDNYNYFYNKNKTVFRYPGATGVKIGYTVNAGRCLVASAKRNGMELIAVVLNDRQWFDDAYSLLDYGFSAYDNVLISKAESRIMNINVTGGEHSTVAAGTRIDAVCPSLKGEKTDINLIYDVEQSVKAPVSRWQSAGEMKIYSGGNYICSLPMYYLEDVEKSGKDN